jgi:hypothetical protein
VRLLHLTERESGQPVSCSFGLRRPDPAHILNPALGLSIPIPLHRLLPVEWSGAESLGYNSVSDGTKNSPPIELVDIVRLRKQHPCGGDTWRVVRLGVDIGLNCRTCGRRILLERPVFERRVRQIMPKESDGA